LIEKSPQQPFRERDPHFDASVLSSKVHNFAKEVVFVNAASRIEFTTALPASSPLLPPGSLIYSAVVIAQRFGGYPSRGLAVERVYGHRKGSPANFFGAGANNIARSYFADYLTPDQVLRQHTLFGFYALGLSKSVESKWAAQLKVGTSVRSAQYKRIHAPEAGALGLRWCAICACSDQLKLGFAAWRVIHQLPFIRSCSVHGVPLSVCCENCKKPLDTGNQFRLPGESCTACGCARFTDLPATANKGYLSLISQCEDAFYTRSEKFRPNAWAERVKKFRASFDSPRTALEALSDRICTKWGVQSPDGVGETLLFPLDKYYVQSSLSGHTSSSSLVAQLIVLDAMYMGIPDGST
jgi:hypothetical protein